MGVYSGVEDPGFTTVGQTFLRGYQLTDQAGEVRFQTIYPGWYPGRAVHIHFKIRTEPGAARGHEFISQLYFADALTSRVYSRMPYSGRTGKPDRNADDAIFARGGDQLLLAPKVNADGYAARFEVGLQIA
jgi:protocatechuate 3,4-dioxygenase beta subunit